MSIRRIGVLTGGGDCPGLNAVIRVVAKAALGRHGWEVFGIEDGFLGLIENRIRRLNSDDVSGIIQIGGTILGTSNRANPARFATGVDDRGHPIFEDVTDRCLAHIAEHQLDAIVAIGGDGTMSGANGLCASGVNVIGVPKTIDNDLVGTEITFGFLTAVQIVSDAIDRLHTTAASHDRIMVVEVMGRNAGWIALTGGVAAGADVILLPEIPYSTDAILAAIEAREARGRNFTIICIAEGARPVDGQQTVARIDPASPDPIRLGGAGHRLSAEIETVSGRETRCTVLGHVQRGGTPCAADRVLATGFGYQAIELLASGARNRLVVRQRGRLTDVELQSAADKQRTIPLDEPLLRAARSVGTTFGEPTDP